MTTPFERTRALVSTRELLQEMLETNLPQNVPSYFRRQANRLLEHYPSLAEIEAAHNSNPEIFGPVPPFSRPSGTADVQGVIDETLLSAKERK
jgi:hypothetical protein